jgi:hypothetical protein
VLTGCFPQLCTSASRVPNTYTENLHFRFEPYVKGVPS